MAIYIAVGLFILFDVITGLIKGLYNDGINSTALRKGLYHKMTEIICVVGSGFLDAAMVYINLDINIHVLNVVTVYICTMELVSILENLAEVNPALNKLFKPFLEKLKTEEKEK